MQFLLIIVLWALSLNAQAEIAFIVTNAEDAITAASQDALGVGGASVLVVAGVVVVSLILSMLRKV